MVRKIFACVDAGRDYPILGLNRSSHIRNKIGRKIEVMWPSYHIGGDRGCAINWRNLEKSGW